MNGLRIGIGMRLGAAYAFMVLLMLGITAVFLYDIDAFSGKLTQINAVNAVKQRHAINFSSSVHDRSIAIRDVVMLPAAERAGPLAAIEALAADYARNERALAEMTATAGASERERALLARIDDIRMRTDPVVDRIIDRTLAGDSPAAEAALAEARPLFVDWLAAIDAYIDHHEAENQRIEAEVRDAAAGFKDIAFAAMGAAALLAVLAGFLVTRSITRPVRSLSSTMRAMADGNYAVVVAGAARRDEIGEMAGTVEVFRKALLAAQEDQRRQNETREAATRNAEAAARRQERVVRDISAGLERLAAGNLTQPIESPANDPFPTEYEMLRQSYNNVLETLGDIVARIGTVAADVKAGARAIDQAAQHLSARSETQAATLEQSAAAITELLESVRSTSAKAGEGEAAGRSNSEQAKTGVDVVRQAIEAMQAIERSSEQMTRIISVIDDIAFQTNLLALNAGVEAARAGEAGRGFAVVASEVRALAQRASESAREIKALISDSATQVARGSTLVAQTDERLSVILRRAMDVQTLMVDIAAATSEQRASLEEISRGVTQLDQVTQQNAAAAEETSSSASTLSQRASALMDALAQFSTAGRGPLAAPSLATGGMLGQPARRAGGMR